MDYILINTVHLRKSYIFCMKSFFQDLTDLFINVSNGEKDNLYKVQNIYSQKHQVIYNGIQKSI